MKAVPHIAFSSVLMFAAVLSSGAATPETIDYAERWTIDSKVLGEERGILVSKPGRYGKGDTRYPVLYLTDGRAHFQHTAATVAFLAGAGRIPEMIVVGVPNIDRNRDLTPSRAAMARPDGSRTKFPTSGGADKFLEFFSTELMPFIDSTYRTQPYTVLVGHSFGGLFAVHALAARPDLFGAYIAASPALPWDNEFVARELKQMLSSRDRLDKAFVVTVGDEPRLRDSFESFVAFLESTEMPGLRWKSRRFADEDHRSVVMQAFYFGLRDVFEGWMLPRDENTGVVLDGFEVLRQHYSELTKRYGYEILPAEGQVERLGKQALHAGDLESAVEILLYNVAHHPDSIRSHQSVGEALEKQGKLEQALVHYKKAVGLAQGNGGREP